MRALLSRLVPPPALARPATPAPAPATGDVDDEPAGCGWFDSSHALQQGLQVRELGTDEPLAEVVPAGWWLCWMLDDELPAVGPERRPSR